ncbi:50S ribosomal protein L22 [Candidatus Gottesmanbacteria bacterium]|nr:50S ribosomal protein L22 [Candidatus Gottesmanbacteria bacterium]
MEYKVTAKYLKVSPRKMRLLADAVRGKDAAVVMGELASMHQHAARLLRPVIASGLANAKAKKADVGPLRLKIVDVLEGPVAKRFHAVSRGMAHSYKKRTTHVRLILVEEEPKEIAAPKEGAKKG